LIGSPEGVLSTIYFDRFRQPPRENAGGFFIANKILNKLQVALLL
jgi:hypothetical protein